MGRIFLEHFAYQVEVAIGETVVGRDIDCGLRFTDPAVSRRHLRLIRRSDEVFVEDLGSANGTHVNGRRVCRAVRLQHGDTLVIGTRRIVLRVIEMVSVSEDTLAIGRLAVRPRASSPSLAALAAPWISPARISRRRHERQSIELRLVYSSRELEVEATSRDLSESGVFVCTPVLEPIGTRCQLRIVVDGGPTLELDGIVRRVIERPGIEPVGLGIELVGVGAATTAWLRAIGARPRWSTDDTDPVDVFVPGRRQS
jgi:hypothetical protein